MIEKLKLQHIVKKYTVRQNICKIFYIDNVINNNTFMPEISTQCHEKTIKLETPYNHNPLYNLDDVILNLFLNKINKDEKNLNIEFNDLQNISVNEKMNFVSKIRHAYMLIHKGTMTSPDSIIFDEKYSDIFYNSLLEHEYFALKYYTHNGLGNKIILFKQPEVNSSNCWCFCYTENGYQDYYALEEIGDFSKQYTVIDFKCLKDIRKKKMTRILHEIN